jgi:hypothetical protein
LQQLPEGPGKKVADAGWMAMNTSAAAAVSRAGVIIGKHPSTLLPECIWLLFVADVPDIQRDYGYEPIYDSDISPSLIRTRIGWHQHSSHAYGQDQGYPSVHLPMRWSMQQDGSTGSLWLSMSCGAAGPAEMRWSRSILIAFVVR